jgi:hypothetical protein
MQRNSKQYVGDYWGERPGAAPDRSAAARPGGPAPRQATEAARLRDAFLQRQVPPANVAPGAEFPAHRRIDPDGPEAECLVQADAPRVRQRDAGVGGVKALQSQQREQRLVEGAPDAATMLPGADVHRDVDRPPIGGSLVMTRGVRVADEVSNDVTASVTYGR